MVRIQRKKEVIIVTSLIFVGSCILTYQLRFNRRFLYKQGRFLLEHKRYQEAFPRYVRFLSWFSDGEYVDKAREDFFIELFLKRGMEMNTSLLPIALSAFHNGDTQQIRDVAELALINIGMGASIKRGDSYRKFLKWWRVNVGRGKVPPGMVRVPAGKFIYRENEVKRLPVFYIDKFEVTNMQYKKFVEATGHTLPHRNGKGSKPYNWKNGTYPEGKANYPVVLVTWNDAIAYAEWAGKRLATPKEWEKAARGTDGRKWPWGNSFDKAKCNTQESKIGGTTPIAAYPQGVSPFGCYDMAGNVWEWVNKYKDGSEFAMQGVRGGSWLDNSGVSCSDYEWFSYAKYQTVGFRCAK